MKTFVSNKMSSPADIAFSNFPDLDRLAKLLMIEMKNTLHQQLAEL